MKTGLTVNRTPEVMEVSEFWRVDSTALLQRLLCGCCQGCYEQLCVHS